MPAYLRIDLILGVCFAIAASKMMAWISRVTDLSLQDETIYLQKGVQLLQTGIPDPQWAPLYSLWYFALSGLTANNIDLFYLNFQFLVIINSVLFYIFLRTLQIKLVISIGSSFLFLIATLHHIQPRPTHFALLCFLGVLILANLRRNNTQYYLFLTTGFAWITFIRPEYIFSLLFMFIIVAQNGLNHWRNQQLSWKKIGLWIGVIILPFILFGNPLSGGRSWLAFSQHFSLNWVNWTDSSLNPWINHAQIMQQVFGTANSIPEALQNNPTLFIKHILSNSTVYFRNSLNLFLPVLGQYALRFFFLKRIYIVVLFAGIIIYLFFKKAQVINCLKTSQFQRLLVTFIAVFVAVLPSILLIFPREHYLVLQNTLILAIFAYLMSFVTPPLKLNWPNALSLGLVIILITPNLAFGWCLTPQFCLGKTETVTLERPNINTVQFIKTLPLKTKTPINFLEAEGGYSIYISDNVQRVYEWQKYETPFKQYQAEKNINMILLSEDLINHPFYRNDQQFKAVINSPQQYNYQSFQIPKTPFTLLVKQDILVDS
ncbi:hypothetical protein PN462_14565 [Spirulina sp. CS-785/01]|uniref:hypothetical protein n=1 Tax=Spirulina sp. CS-785/01 TaxID=3021716 RepID=UPI00232BFFBB|nr:hypothetical protein [Spirulina sp. CS-785/01]MDB9314334.1 hypothetical protein [Spirulina sp. CS-785/01]